MVRNTARLLILTVLVSAAGCSKPPAALAVDELRRAVPALADQGYTYFVAESLGGGFMVVFQQAEYAPATSATTPVFWIAPEGAHVVNPGARSLAPDLPVAPGIVFDLVDPALFPQSMAGAFTELLTPPPEDQPST